jgi:(2Fe-2S) ferredoxin
MSDSPSTRFQILICDGPSCGVTHESERLVECAKRHLNERPDLKDRVTVANYTCYGRCEEGPNMFVRQLAAGDDPFEEPDVDILERQRGFYPGVDEAKVVRIADEHCGLGRVIDEWVDDY